MPIDPSAALDTALNGAKQLLRQGTLDGAVDASVRLVAQAGRPGQ